MFGLGIFSAIVVGFGIFWNINSLIIKPILSERIASAVSLLLAIPIFLYILKTLIILSK